MFKNLSSRTWKPLGWLATLFLLAFMPSQSFGQCVIEFTSCPPATVTIPDCDADGMETLTWTIPTATVTATNGASCGTITVTQTGGPVHGASTSHGTYAITYTAQVIENGSVIVTKTCNFNAVVVADVDPPVITCPADLTVVADASCAGSVPNLTTGATVMDICPTTVTQDIMSGTSFGSVDGATQVVVLTATDGSGNSAACSMTVTSADSTAPSLTCPADISVDTDAGMCSTASPSLGSPTGSDNCGASSSPTAVEPTYALGTNTVTWIWTDDAGNSSSCNQTVTVEDNEDPAVTMGTIAAQYTRESAADSAAIAATTYSDNCTMNPTVSSSVSFSGCTATFTVTVTDESSNSATASYSTVIDGDGPDISALTGLFDGQEYECGDNIEGDLSELEQLAIDDGFVSDVCSATVTVVAVEDTTAGVCAGTYSVERTATYSDEYGNTSDLVYTYTVADEDGPRIDNDANELDYTISCDDMNLGSGSATLDPLEQAPTASDACGSAVTITEGMPLYSETPAMGAYTITRTWTTMDACGNTGSSYTQVISVIDTLAPTFDACQDLTVNIESMVTYLVPSSTCQGSIPDFSNAAVTDNCMTGDSITVSQDVSGLISVTHNGTTVVTLTADDNQGNTSTCEQTITWKDVTAPMLSCMDVTVSADANCEAASVSLSGTSATDNCTASVTIADNSSSVTPYQLGDNTVTFTATDDANNSSTCSINVEVLDATAPMITCPSDVTVSADFDCEYDLSSLTEATATDNCDASIDIDNGCNLPTLLPSFCTIPLGSHTLTWTATDDADNSASCTQVVTVEDNTAPSVTCPGDITIDTDAGSCDVTNASLDVYLVGFEDDATIDDNCTAAGDFTITHDGSLILNLGDNVINYTVTDESSNSSGCSVTITVEDNEDPTITCPADISVDADANCTASPTLGSASAMDNCTMSSVPMAMEPSYVLGDNSVTWSIMDDASNSASCTQKVTVVDNTAPSITCPANVTVNTDMDMCTYASSSLSGASATDNCTAMLTVSNDAATDLPLGSNTINWTVQDAALNSSGCSQQVTVVDAQVPTISCPSDVTVDADANCQGQALLAATAMDNCPSPMQSDDAPAMFELGNTTVNFSVVDGSANSAACSMTVTVVDVTAPVASVPTDGADITGYACGSTVMIDADNSACIATRTLSKPVFSDNCDMSTTNTSAASGGVHLTNLGFAMLSNFPTGTTTVSFMGTDDAGNSTVCSVDIQVTDAQFPVVTNCPLTITMANDPGLCSANVSWVAPIASDNCPGVTLMGSAVSPAGSMTPYGGSAAPGASFPVGTYTYTYSATDAAGNTSTCSFDIEVTDSEAPTIACPDNLTVSADMGACSASTVSIGNPTMVTDNCSWTTTTSDATSSYAVGLNTVVWTATDASGNEATCAQTVTVEDNELPMIACPADMTLSTDVGSCDATVEYAEPTGTDNCSATTSLVSGPANGSMLSVGTATAVWEATDASGNSAQCMFNITVETSTVWYADTDGDGYGDAAVSIVDCAMPTGYVADNTDCDDTDVNISPGATEICDGKDNNCDGQIDEGVAVSYYADSDGDGYGDASGSAVVSCTAPMGYVADNTDCDDTDINVNPGAMEVCDGIDNDCDGQIDESGTCTIVTQQSAMNITSTSGTITWSGSMCASRYYLWWKPGGGDSWNKVWVDAPTTSYQLTGLEENKNFVWKINTFCDGVGTSSGFSPNQVFRTLNAVVVYYPDTDGDGFGDGAGSPVYVATMGYVLDNTDCDDTKSTVYPGATEVCDGVDNNCNGQVDEVTTCLAITGLSATNITATSAALLWTGDDCAAYYKVQYNIAGSGAGGLTTVIVNAPSTNLTVLNLSPDTRYSVRIRAFCNGAYATISAPEVFTTAAVVPRSEDMVQHMEKELDVQVSPNPAQDFITVQLTGTTDKPALLTIVDPVGRVILKREAAMENGMYTNRIDLNNYPTGSYLLRVQSEDEIKIVRVLKAGK